MRYADVIVPLAVEGIYTYSVPLFLENRVVEGSLVLVAFAGNKKYTALVCRLHDKAPEGIAVKAIEELAEDRVNISPLHLKFLLWIGEYYMATPGEVMKAAFPVAFRLESYTSIALVLKEIDYVSLTANEKALLSFLQPNRYVPLREVEKYLKIKNALPLVKKFLAQGVVKVKETVDELFQEKKEQVVTWEKIFAEEELGRWLDCLKKAPAQRTMLCRWIECGENELEKSKFLHLTGQSAAALKGLCEKKILKVVERKLSRLEGELQPVGHFSVLNDEQQGALDKVLYFFKEKDCVLLQGVTSSGKTEVYIRLIQEYLDQGRQILYMLPEIALTIQIVKRLQRVFGNRIGIYHSGMSDRMRAELWRKQCSREPFQLILGVRSSIFLPFRDLGLIIVDEEHDVSYKQKEPAPRYHGRDAAIMLGKMTGARVLLGSATPSFESFRNALERKYGFVQMRHRYGGIQLPEIQLADLKEYRRKKQMKGSFSPLLVEEMRKTLAEQKQVILFQNRRGYSTYVQCDCCGEVPKCRYCDVSLTYYKQRNVLVCRYCGMTIPMQEHCMACGEGCLRLGTPGTERIEEEIRQLFPDSRVVRIDLDMMGCKSRFRAVIEEFERGEIDVLIGTQMVTKGLDFENVRLVGVIDADSMVNFPDFRAEERAYCMLMQVSGRSGRRGERGKVIIQSADVKNRVYAMLIEGDYQTFFARLSSERKIFAYPPYGRMIQLELRHRDGVLLRNAANELAMRLRECFGTRICGPAVPEIGRIGGLYRLIFLLKLEAGCSCSEAKVLLKREFVNLGQKELFKGIRIFCDVDPQ